MKHSQSSVLIHSYCHVNTVHMPINEVDQLLTIICGFSILHLVFSYYYISNYKYTP